MEHEVSNIHQQPWGKAIGLFVSCIVILAGIMKHVGPAQIVIRAVVAGLLTALVVRIFIWTAVTSGTSDEDKGLP